VPELLPVLVAERQHSLRKYHEVYERRSVIVVNSASPYRTLADLLDAVRAKPGDLTLAGSGSFYIAFEMLKRAANLNMTFVPYPGGAPAVTALLGEHVTSVFTDYPTLAEQLKAGKLRALATGSRARAEALPDVSR
jgi:tripartite-type tricarboxylate transporter receptor subunit TctC